LLLCRRLRGSPAAREAAGEVTRVSPLARHQDQPRDPAGTSFAKPVSSRCEPPVP